MYSHAAPRMQVCQEICHLRIHCSATNDRLLPIGGNLSLSLSVLSVQAYLQSFNVCQMRFSQLYARKKRRRNAEETDRERLWGRRERLRGMKGGRQGRWLAKRFAFSTCYAFCPCEAQLLCNAPHRGGHLPQCLVSLCPPVAVYVRSASILHKG